MQRTSVWTALDKSDDDMSAAGGGSLHFYNSSHASTSNGFLNVSTTTEKTTWTGFNPFKQAFVDLEKVRVKSVAGGKSVKSVRSGRSKDLAQPPRHPAFHSLPSLHTPPAHTHTHIHTHVHTHTRANTLSH
jgi:hypothetical protein